MAEIVESVEISRRPEDVFSYVADPSHHPEWIESVVSARRQGDAPLAAGSRVLVTRRVGSLGAAVYRGDGRAESSHELGEPRCRRHPGHRLCQRHG